MDKIGRDGVYHYSKPSDGSIQKAEQVNLFRWIISGSLGLISILFIVVGWFLVDELTIMRESVFALRRDMDTTNDGYAKRIESHVVADTERRDEQTKVLFSLDNRITRLEQVILNMTSDLEHLHNNDKQIDINTNRLTKLETEIADMRRGLNVFERGDRSRPP